MSRSIPASAIVLSTILSTAAWGQVDAKAVVRQSIENYQHDWREALDWRYQQTDVSQADGATKDVEVSEIIPLGGTPYQRLIEKDGHSLSPADQAKEDRKYKRVLRQRENESETDRQYRIQKYERDRAFVKDIPEAYDFKLLGEEDVNGRPAWMIRMTPRPGFVPTVEHAAMLAHIDGKLWIDKEDVQWAKAEADIIQTISIGWVLARIGPGAHITLTQTRVAPGFWMPKELTISGAARVLLVHNKILNEDLTYSGYRHGPEGTLARKGVNVSPHPGPGQAFR